jgi:hypothetical protein
MKLIKRNSNLVFVGLGFPFLARRTFPPPGRHWTPNNESPGLLETLLQKTRSKLSLATVYILFNIAVVALACVGPYKNADGSQRVVKGWYYIVIINCAIGLGAICYVAAFSSGRWSILRLGGAQKTDSWVTYMPEHHFQYGLRKYVKIELVSFSLPDALCSGVWQPELLTFDLGQGTGSQPLSKISLSIVWGSRSRFSRIQDHGLDWEAVPAAARDADVMQT